MIQPINSIKPTITGITKNPKALAAIAAGTLAVLSTHQVWPHPEKATSHPRIEEIPEVPEIDNLPDVDSFQYTPFGDIVAGDNVIDVVDTAANGAKSLIVSVAEFFENLG